MFDWFFDRFKEKYRRPQWLRLTQGLPMFIGLYFANQLGTIVPSHHFLRPYVEALAVSLMFFLALLIFLLHQWVAVYENGIETGLPLLKYTGLITEWEEIKAVTLFQKVPGLQFLILKTKNFFVIAPWPLDYSGRFANQVRQNCNRNNPLCKFLDTLNQPSSQPQK